MYLLKLNQYLSKLPLLGLMKSQFSISRLLTNLGALIIHTLEGEDKKSSQTFYFTLQKGLVLESKVKLGVKTIGQELQNEELYISVAPLLLEIQQDLYKK